MARTTILVLAALAPLAACGAGPASSERPVGPAPTVVSTTTTTAATTTAVPTTVVPDTTTTVVETTSTVVETTTTVPEAVAELVLRADGIGGARFGAEADAVITYVTGIAGAPTFDSGWVPAADSPFGVCPGAEARGVQWGDLLLLFGDVSAVSSGSQHFFSYNYGTFSGQPAVPAGLRTDGGLALNDTVAQLRVVHPDVQVYDDPAFGAGFTVTAGGLSGVLTDATDAGRISVLYGGIGCGE